jgi:hypothetical protein
MGGLKSNYMLERDPEPGTSCYNPGDDTNQQERLFMRILRGHTLDLDRKFPVRVLAYTAGMLDGEGSITTGISKHGRVSTFVGISNTDMGVLEWFQEQFGGGVIQWNGVTPGKGKKKVHYWRIPSASQTEFLKLMIPFLKIKVKQMRLMMVLRSLIERKAKPERILRRGRDIQALNKAAYIEEDMVHAKSLQDNDLAAPVADR